MKTLIKILSVLFALAGVWFTLALLLGGNSMLREGGLIGVWGFGTLFINAVGGFCTSLWLWRLQQKGLLAAAIIFANNLLLSLALPLSGHRYSPAAVFVVAALMVLGLLVVMSGAARRVCVRQHAKQDNQSST